MLMRMGKKKALRKFEDSYRLASRSLVEIRQGLDLEVNRLRYKHQLRVGDEPLSLTGLSNLLAVWYLSQPETSRDCVVREAIPQLEELLRLETPKEMGMELLVKWRAVTDQMSGSGDVLYPSGDGSDEVIHRRKGESKDALSTVTDSPSPRSRKR